jgi:glycosyltransferase involved in cell wall biosynthesis
LTGYSGLLVDAGDINTLANRIITVLFNPSLALEIGKNALKRIRYNFSMQKDVSSYTHLYEQLIHGENSECIQ